MLYCQVCQKEFNSLRSLHGHLKAHGMSMGDYYQKYYPRFDLYNNQLIEFKNYDYYFSNLFHNRKNLTHYFESAQITEEEKCDCLKRCITDRELVKDKFIRAPKEVECLTMVFPDPYTLIQSGVNYPAYFKNACNYYQRLEFDNKPLSIIIDTREQKPVMFHKTHTVRNKLDYGDYCTTSHYKGVYVERKSWGDFWGTLSQPDNYERFKRELKRCEELNNYLVIAIEGNIQEMFKYKPKFSKATGEFIGHQIRDLMQNFDCQFVFTPKNAIENTIRAIFKLQNDIKTVDLYYHYLKNELKV